MKTAIAWSLGTCKPQCTRYRCPRACPTTLSCHSTRGNLPRSVSGRIWGMGAWVAAYGEKGAWIVWGGCVCVCSHMGDGSRCRMGEGSLSGSYEEGDTTRICDNFVSQPTHLVQEHTTLFVTFWRAQPTHLIQPMNTRKKKTGAPAPPKTGKWSVTPIIMIIVDLVLN